MYGSSVNSISIIDGNTETYKAKLDAMFRPEETASLTEEELEKRKKRLNLWLIKNRLPQYDNPNMWFTNLHGPMAYF
jgi:hypothetical protein